ncbi:hypothetical protein BT69DRAFT_1354546 [Atractiella rhizophila]|nr:hypothetical protein BT69DRAFT_1354546 [Atractiella rhizophila]
MAPSQPFQDIPVLHGQYDGAAALSNEGVASGQVTELQFGQFLQDEATAGHETRREGEEELYWKEVSHPRESEECVVKPRDDWIYDPSVRPSYTSPEGGLNITVTEGSLDAVATIVGPKKRQRRRTAGSKKSKGDRTQLGDAGEELVKGEKRNQSCTYCKEVTHRRCEVEVEGEPCVACKKRALKTGEPADCKFANQAPRVIGNQRVCGKIPPQHIRSSLTFLLEPCKLKKKKCDGNIKTVCTRCEKAKKPQDCIMREDKKGKQKNDTQSGVHPDHSELRSTLQLEDSTVASSSAAEEDDIPRLHITHEIQPQMVSTWMDNIDPKLLQLEYTVPSTSKTRITGFSIQPQGLAVPSSSVAKVPSLIPVNTTGTSTRPAKRSLQVEETEHEDDGQKKRRSNRGKK